MSNPVNPAIVAMVDLSHLSLTLFLTLPLALSLTVKWPEKIKHKVIL